jgi:hypothetical protein
MERGAPDAVPSRLAYEAEEVTVIHLVSAAASVLCLCTGLACLVMAATRVGDRSAQLAHGVMGVAMAGMFSPWGDPVPACTGIVGFSVLGAWFATLVLRGDRSGHSAPHLAISSAAMVLMYVLHPAAAAGPGPDAPAGHHGGHSGSVPTLIALPLALLLAGYFAWHTWNCVERCRTPRPRDSAMIIPRVGKNWPANATSGVARAEPVAHGVMSALMAAMFLGAM